MPRSDAGCHFHDHGVQSIVVRGVGEPDVKISLLRRIGSTVCRFAALELHPKEIAVQVVGYLLGVKLEGREATNCGSDAPEERDFHVWLANSPDDDRLDAVVVEVTPRVRARHPSWSLTNLRRFVRQRSRVRISGWLMLDEGHPEQVGKTRVTLWEIHPILRIEVWSAGRWRELP